MFRPEGDILFTKLYLFTKPQEKAPTEVGAFSLFPSVYAPEFLRTRYVLGTWALLAIYDLEIDGIANFELIE